jgi:hypothetical protein
MAIKFFVNNFDGNSSDSIAINSDQVISVYETEVEEGTGKKKTTRKITNIYCHGNATFQVKEKYLDVVARLNEV